MKQAEQKAVLAEFRAGSFNTLVATCIGEEGLDIPEVRLRLGRAFGIIKAVRFRGCHSILTATCIGEEVR